VNSRETKTQVGERGRRLSQGQGRRREDKYSGACTSRGGAHTVPFAYLKRSSSGGELKLKEREKVQLDEGSETSATNSLIEEKRGRRITEAAP